MKKTDKENYLTEEQEINGTPFILRRVEEKWFITIGDYRLTEPTREKYETLDKLINEQYLITTKLIAIAVDKLTHKQDNMTYETESL